MHVHNPLEQFSVIPIFLFDIFGKKIAITNLALMACFASLFFITISFYLLRNISIKPTKKQVVLEIFYEMIYDMVKGTIGEAKGKKFVPLIFSLFVFILLCNLFGMIPYSFAVTSHITVTLTIAAIVFAVILSSGIILHGIRFVKVFAPSGCPIWLLPLMMIIELFSFISKPVSISLRLAANITSGHILLHVIASFIVSMWGISKIIPFGFSIIIIAFEFGVCILQAYIFSILSCVYLNDVLELH